MIFQQFNLVKRHTVLDNVLSGALGRSHAAAEPVPALLRGGAAAGACACLERVGMADRAASRADALSGGQQQRVAIARALMQRPRLILADEPVASLDPALRHSVMRHIEALNREEGMTVICSLHDIDLVSALRDARWSPCGTGGWSGRASRSDFDPATFRVDLRRGGRAGIQHGV